MSLSRLNPITRVAAYRRYLATKIDACGRPIRTLLLHQDEPHEQDDTPEDLVLITIPPNMTDPRWDSVKNRWYEGSISRKAWEIAKWLLVPTAGLIFLFLYVSMAMAEPYVMPFPMHQYLLVQLGTGGIARGTANASRLQGRFLSSTAPTNGQVIKWSGVNNRWEPAADAGGAGSSIWSDLTNPTANLSLSHGAFTTSFVWGASTGAGVNLMSFADTPNNTGTGLFLDFNRGSGSALAGPYRYRDNGVPKFQIGGTGRTRVATEVSVYETADVADNTNFSMFDIFSSGTTFRLQVHAAGTGVLRPILLGFDDNVTFTERARLSTSGGLSLGTGGIDPGAGVFNVDTGYRLGNAATTGNVLRGNGTNFVSAVLALADTSGTLGEIRGGTNQTSYTLGDILYSSAANTLAKLAGNITATKNFLTQTGNGTVSAAPAWGTIADGDIPAAIARDSEITLPNLQGGASPAQDYNFAAATMTRVETAAGVPPALECDAAAEVGSVRMRSDANAANASHYVCSQTSATPTFAWELTQGAGGGGYSEIQDEGTAQTARTKMNFVGPVVIADDDAANTRTRIRVLDPITMAFQYDEFTVGGATTLNVGDLGWAVTATGSFLALGESGRPGIFRISTTATAGNQNVINLRDDEFNPADNWDFTWIIRLPQTDADTQVRIGMLATVGSDPTSGMFVEKVFADLNWFAVTRDGATQTRTDTTVVVTANAWVNVRVRRKSPTEIAFSINGGTEIVHTANIHAGAVTPTAQIKTNAAVVKSLDHDYFGILVTGLSR